MTYSEFKAYTAAFLQRSTTAFVQGSVDVLGVAINQARKTVERMHDFEMARVQAQLAMPTNGSTIALNTVKLFGTETLIDVKTVKRAFISASGGSWIPIDVIGRDQHIAKVRRAVGEATSSTVADIVEAGLYENYKFVRYGLGAYVAPAGASNYSGSSTVDIMLDAIRWLDPYTADGDTDFLLEYCSDLLLMQTIKWLNLSMREDQRIPVSAEAFDAAWRAMQDWNRSVAWNEDESTLQ